MSDSSRLVENFNTPLTGGVSAIGLVASMTAFCERFASPAARNASAAAVPLTAKTTSSPNFPASAIADATRGMAGAPIRKFRWLARSQHDLMAMFQETAGQHLRNISQPRTPTLMIFLLVFDKRGTLDVPKLRRAILHPVPTVKSGTIEIGRESAP